MLSRPWTLHHYLENEADMTAHFDTVYADFTLNFYESGNFTQTYLYNGISPYSKTGTWKFLNVVNQIQLTDDVQSVIYNINTLTESTFDFEHTEVGILKQYVMISK
ncbi:MAG: lipocalin family protein [Chitinophagales bacterium]